jgi:ABC-type Fe3+/spermidine/putrescine transport system ATPase subunit
MLTIRDLTFQYGTTPVLYGIHLDVRPGEIVAVLGASGSGKSTLLRVIAGLERMQSGLIAWDGQSVDHLAAHQRGFGLMFQDYALFPHFNVIENVMFGLRMKGLPRNESRQRAQEMLRRVRMEEFARRSVSDLSGGEKQRVALARSLVAQPRLLMLDEPFGALDAALRRDLIEEVRTILAGGDTAVIYVTHDQAEAFSIADRIALMHRGRFIQVTTPIDLLSRPENAYVARFLGLGNLLRVERPSGDRAETAIGTIDLKPDDDYLFIHPWAVQLGETGIPASVQSISIEGLTARLTVCLSDGQPLSFSAAARSCIDLQPGQGVHLQIDRDLVYGMKADPADSL